MRSTLRFARFDPFLQVRQRRGDAGLQQHFGVTLATPDHERRAMIRTLEARAFVADGFHEPLFVGLFIIERVRRQQLTRLNWNFGKLHRLIAHVSPLVDESVIDEMRGVRYDEALAMMRRLMRSEGLAVGISSAASIVVALRLAADSKGKATILTIAYDSAHDYLDCL